MVCQLPACEEVPMGTYNLTTKATDNIGISAVSVPVSAAPAETYLLGCPIAATDESATIFICFI